jgi:predicted Zn-dependent protease
MFKRLAQISMIVAVSLAGAGGARAGEVLRVGDAIVKWAAPATGAATVVTYTLLTGPYALPSDKRTLSPDNCGVMRPFAEIVSVSAGVSDFIAREELRSAFTEWEAVANIKFIEVSRSNRADILVGATDAASGPAFANLSLSGGRGIQTATKALGAASDGRVADFLGATKDRPVAGIEQAYVCLNSKMRWKIGFDGSLDVYDLRYTFMHEIGHAIGLDHPGKSGSIMGYRYDERVRRLQPSDIEAAQRLYGAPTVNR